MPTKKIDNIADSIDKLPTIPVIYTKLMKLLRKPDTTVQDISELISQDPVLTAKILNLVNSSFYNFPKKIGSLQRAVVLVGISEINSLVQITGIMQMFGQFKSNNGFSMDSLWEHSIGCAVASKVLAEAAHLKNPEEVFAGGLMHDIGKVVHAICLPEKFMAVIEDIQKSGMSLIEAEENILEVNHAQSGKLLAEKWQFPEQTGDMIAYHHLSHETDILNKETAAIHIGNILANALALGSSGEKHIQMANEKAWEILDLKMSQLELIMNKINKLFQESINTLKS